MLLVKSLETQRLKNILSLLIYKLLKIKALRVAIYTKDIPILSGI